MKEITKKSIKLKIFIWGDKQNRQMLRQTLQLKKGSGGRRLNPIKLEMEMKKL